MIFSSKIPDELKILFLLINQDFSKNHITEIQSIFKNNTVLSKNIISIAFTNQVAGFIHKNTKHFDFFPEELKRDFHKLYKEIAHRNMRLLAETLSVLKLLDQNNIPTIPLKGAIASDLLFNDFGVYPAGDLDILVHPKVLETTKKLLCEKSGFSQAHHISEGDLVSNHYHLILKKNNLLLEIHWNLVKRYFSISPDFWFEDAKEITWNGIKTFELSIEKNIIYQIFRLFDHCFYPLRFYLLLSFTIHKNSNIINWHKLLDFAGRHHMKKLVISTLKLIKDILNTNIPQKVTQENTSGYKYFKALVLSGIYSGIKKKHFRMMNYSVLLIEPELVLGILSGRLFPSKGELRLRYNIQPGSKKIYLYYIANPLLLLFKNIHER